MVAVVAAALVTAVVGTAVVAVVAAARVAALAASAGMRLAMFATAMLIPWPVSAALIARAALVMADGTVVVTPSNPARVGRAPARVVAPARVRVAVGQAGAG